MSSDLTVIVVGYNHSAYVLECLESIRTQTLKPDKVLVADDASSDGSREVIADYVRRTPGLFEFHPNASNQGLNRTLNAMLDLVRTKYVTYISADDYMLPKRIETQIGMMRAADAAVSYSDAVVVDDKSEVIADSSRGEYPWPEEPARSERMLECLFEANWIPAASIMLDAGMLRAAGGYNEDIFYEDYELLTRAAASGWRFAYVEEPLVAVRRLSTSLGAIGFSGSSYRFLRSQEAALKNFPVDGSQLSRRVLAARWEIAKRSARLAPTWRAACADLWGARKGASSPASLLWHLVRVPAGNRISRDESSRSSVTNGEHRA